jgi:hypothetical protein
MRSPCHIAVAARKGDVTLTGTIQFEYQRIAALHAARGIDGVRRVMDQLKVQAKVAQKIITLQSPITEIAAPVMEKTAQTMEKTIPTAEKTAPADADLVTCRAENRDLPSNPV